MFKKNWYMFLPLLLVIIPGLIWTYYKVSFGYSSSEATEATRYFLHSGTRYSQKYSDEAFGRVRAGMDGKQVFELVGVPFERHDNDATWIFSGPTNLQAPYYHERKVLFTRDAKNVPRVKAVVKEFHRP